MLPSLVDVFEEDPVVEAAALGALTARFRHNVLPAHVMSRGESLEYFQNVGQFRCQLPVRLLHPAAWTPNVKPAGLSPSSKRSATPSASSQPPDHGTASRPHPASPGQGPLPPAQLRTILVSGP